MGWIITIDGEVSKLGSIQTLWIPELYSALLGEGLVPSPFVFQGEGGVWGYSLDLRVYLWLLNDFELQVYSALLGV